MANDERRSYPVLYPKYWWAFRELFKRSIPSVLSPNAIASQFNMKEKSANDNIIPSLRMLGIID